MDVISTEENYSFIIDEEDVICYKTGKHMNGEEIGKHFGLTRAMISKILKQSFEKIYYHIKKTNRDITPFEIASIMAEMFKIKGSEQYVKFYNMFPIKLKEKILNDAITKAGVYRYCKLETMH